MMGKIIVLCRHAVETLTYFSMQLAEAFTAWGYEIFWMDFEKTGLSAWKLRQIVPQKEAVLLTFNFIGLSGEEELWEFSDEGEPVRSLWEKLDMPCLNIMVDHPVYYAQALQYPAGNLRTFCIDRDHVAFMKRFYPHIFCEFLPLAGNCQIKDSSFVPETDEMMYEQWMRRPYTLAFTANYVPVSEIERQFAAMEPEYREFYYGMIESLIQEPDQNLLSCMETHLRREIPDLSDADLCKAMSTMPAVDLWIRTYFREKTVRILVDGGTRVHVSGKDWEKIACDHPENLICTGRMVNSADCVRAMAQAKLALNTMPWFKDGAHDRIFTAILQGTAVLTDGSAYLREQFWHMDTLVYYDLHHLDELPEQVRELLAHPRRLFDMACRGQAAARQAHMWKHRAQQLKNYM